MLALVGPAERCWSIDSRSDGFTWLASASSSTCVTDTRRLTARIASARHRRSRRREWLYRRMRVDKKWDSYGRGGAVQWYGRRWQAGTYVPGGIAVTSSAGPMVHFPDRALAETGTGSDVDLFLSSTLEISTPLREWTKQWWSGVPRSNDTCRGASLPGVRPSAAAGVGSSKDSTARIRSRYMR